MKIFYAGTLFILRNKACTEDEFYILADSFEPEYVFQIICISGYNAGRNHGYIQKDPQAEISGFRGVTLTHLKNEIDRNFNYYKKSLKIFPDPRIDPNEISRWLSK